jgi:DNA helicase-2/ATP-dependent DNA helicase PcrA
MSVKLTDKQIEAIQSNDTNLRIIACAGSGKTTTIAHKIAFLLNAENNLDVEPENIIAFTYTEKAAAELKNKVLEEVGPQKGLADMYIGTIHGWCLKALQENEYKYQKYSVLDEIKLQLFVDKNYDKIGMKDICKLSSPNEVMRRFVDTKRFVRIMEVIRESNLTTTILPENISRAKEKYDKALKDKNYFDFSMIVDKALEQLESNDSNLQKHIKAKLRYLIVDEYQDVNPKQERLIESLYKISNAKLTVVGDDDQNIYQWRGSNNKFIIEFDKKYQPCKNVEIVKNFRSSIGITDLSKTFINNNQDRINKTIISAESQDFIKGQDILYNEYDNIEEENIAICKFIEKLHGVEFKENKNSQGRGLAYSDFCILLRTWNKAESIVEELERKGIPYITAGVNHLFETPEVKASVAIFKYLNDHITSKGELKQLWLNLPFKNYSDSKLDYAINQLDEKKPKTKYGQNAVGGKLSDKDFAYNLQNIFWGFLEDAEIFEESFISREDENTFEKAELIFYNIGKFSQVINDFEEINFNSSIASFHLFSFLSFINYAAQEYYPEGWIDNPYKVPNAVQIMTIHQAKGLEFPVVFVPGLNRNYLPQKRRGGLTEWHYLDRSLIENQERYEGNIEDERRLLYVALTRAQKYLLLSRAPDANNRLYRKESEFVSELNKSKLLVSRKDEDFSTLTRIDPKPLEKVNGMTLDFTVLKDFFDCPYRFKLVSMFGFSYPLEQRMGLGKSFHNALMELHKRAKDGHLFTDDEINDIAERQMYFPYLANARQLRVPFEQMIKENLKKYYTDNRDELQYIIFVEQAIQLKLDEGLIVTGKVDLIKKSRGYNNFETTIIEFKSQEDSQSTRLTDDQLKLYALGHKVLTGEMADYLMTYIIGTKESRSKVPYKLKPQDLEEIEQKINDCAEKIRGLEFNKTCEKKTCENCLQSSLCSNRINLNIKSQLKKR